jgi:hypothetical protein
MQYSRNNDPNHRLLSAHALDRGYEFAQPFMPDTLICIILFLVCLADRYYNLDYIDQVQSHRRSSGFSMQSRYVSRSGLQTRTVPSSMHVANIS